MKQDNAKEKKNQQSSATESLKLKVNFMDSYAVSEVNSKDLDEA